MVFSEVSSTESTIVLCFEGAAVQLYLWELCSRTLYTAAAVLAEQHAVGTVLQSWVTGQQLNHTAAALPCRATSHRAAAVAVHVSSQQQQAEGSSACGNI
jgi:hypothetical protein